MPGVLPKITILKSQPAWVCGTDWGKGQTNRPDRNLEGDLGREGTEVDDRQSRFEREVHSRDVICRREGSQINNLSFYLKK